jgi:hypothetical protein
MRPGQVWLWAGLLTLLACLPLAAQTGTVAIYSENFDSYTSYAATNLYDTTYAFPTGAPPALVIVGNNPYGWPAASGVQLINWLSHSGTQSLLVRSGCEADINLFNTRSGSRYQLDFWLYVHKSGTNGTAGTRNWFMRPGGMGTDNNGDDYIAYRSDRAAGSDKIYNYNGIDTPANWIYIGTNNTEDVWQHHRLSVDTLARIATIYIDDMTNAVYSGHIARPYVAVPTIWRLQNEGTTANDGWYAIDDLSLTVDNAVTNLATAFTEGFESYTAGNNPAGGPWITVACDGTASGSALDPAKVQVVDTNTVTPHSGTKCLRIQGGQFAGATFAWGGGTLPQPDVQITWWTMVPSAIGSSATADEMPLRMAFYDTEGGSAYAADSADLGYGIRSGIGGPTNLIIYTTAWVNTGVSFTPNTWEEYQLTTYNSQGTYSLVKNPSSGYPTVIVNNAPFISTATKFGPPLMVAFSQSQTTASSFEPVYVDDITIKSLVSTPPPAQAHPYAIQIQGTRFTNTTTLTLGGPIGGSTVDPQDKSTVVFMTDAVSGGGIYQARKVAPGNWAADPIAAATPIVGGLAYPSGVTISPYDHSIWWVHDWTASVMRLKSPWSTNTAQQIIADFVCLTNDPAAGGVWLDDDPCDIAFPPTNFFGTISQNWPATSTWPTSVTPNYPVVMDRGTDFNGNNTLYLVDPGTTNLMQTNYDWYLYGPTTSGMGSTTLVGMTTLAASGEMVSLNQDGQVTAMNANGVARSFWPEMYQDPSVAINPACIASDPVTGRLWIGDQLWEQVFSCAPDGSDCQVELSFSLSNTNEMAFAQLVFHSPGGSMAFAPDGSFMVLSDNSTMNGGGRLVFFHNEKFTIPPFAITNASPSGHQVNLAWSAAGAVTYNVQRSLNLTTNAASFQNIATNLTTRQFTDTNAPSAGAFYRVVAAPSLIP